MAECANGHANPDGQKFCGECGAPIAAAEPPSDEATTAAEAPPETDVAPPGTGTDSTPAVAAVPQPWYRKPVVLVAGALAIVVVVVIIAVAGGGDDNETVQSGDGDSSVVTSEKRRTTTTEPEDENEQRDIEVGKQGFSIFQPEFSDTLQGSYGVTFENPNSSRWIASNVTVNVSFFDASNAVVKTETNTIAAILPGQTAAIGDNIFDMPGSATRMEVQARVGRWEETDETTGALTFDGISTIQQEFGGLRTNATVTSTFANDIENVQAVAIYVDGGGQVVGGAFTFVDFVPAGGAIGVEISSFSEIPNVAGTEVYGNLSFLSLT